MSLVFAAITPHPPLLIPAIGKDSINSLQKTKESLEKMEEELYLAHPDVVVVISPHGQHFPEAFSIGLSPRYESDLKEFGDLTTKINFAGEIQMPYNIRTHTYETEAKTIIINEPRLDHGVAVPLFYLGRHLPEIKIMPIGFCDLDAKAHLEFGGLMKEQIMKNNKRVAVIASADLSHALTNGAPAGFNQNGAEFDAKVQELLAARNTAGLLTLPDELVKGASECGLRSILILLGILRDMNYRYESYSYEGPFGVGYLTANFVL